MGVYIKGMEMPTNCSDCPMCYDMMECTVAEPIINFFKEEELEKFDFFTERHPRCPLVPVPPHGRLIDADKIGLTDFEIILCQKGNPFKNALEMFLEKIENAPTIIQTEEE